MKDVIFPHPANPTMVLSFPHVTATSMLESRLMYGSIGRRGRGTRAAASRRRSLVQTNDAADKWITHIGSQRYLVETKTAERNGPSGSLGCHSCID